MNDDSNALHFHTAVGMWTENCQICRSVKTHWKFVFLCVLPPWKREDYEPKIMFMG